VDRTVQPPAQTSKPREVYWRSGSPAGGPHWNVIVMVSRPWLFVANTRNFRYRQSGVCEARIRPYYSTDQTGIHISRPPALCVCLSSERWVMPYVGSRREQSLVLYEARAGIFAIARWLGGNQGVKPIRDRSCLG